MKDHSDLDRDSECFGVVEIECNNDEIYNVGVTLWVALSAISAAQDAAPIANAAYRIPSD